MAYKLLKKFEDTFHGQKYLHRNANLGNRIADYLYEDLYDVGLSRKFVYRVNDGTRVLNPKNKTAGIKARRGDGSFGDIVPGFPPQREGGFAVPRGPTANVEIGTEVKIIAKAMIKQIDRVMNDLCNQAKHFQRHSSSALTIGIVGVNHAQHYTSFEGRRSYRTTGKGGYLHPIQEAEETKARLISQAKPCFFEFVILEFDAMNEKPYPFKWTNATRTEEEYGAMLVRIAREYDVRFP
ncbi:MAG: hypothetical protein WBW16_12370 [Bacteroidota bacterium]